jgi:DNA-directed RNA polymerase specialized sigma24 family protein
MLHCSSKSLTGGAARRPAGDRAGAGTSAEEPRVAVALVLIEGLPYKEAAQIIGVPIGTLTSRLARGRQALQEALEPGDAA